MRGTASGCAVQDYAEAACLYRLEADQGVVGAQANLWVFYADGLGVPQDFSEAVRLYRLAAAKGLANAQHKLGVCYGYGQGVLKDEVEAARLYRLAADQGHARAQFDLGERYAHGMGVRRMWPAHKACCKLWAGSPTSATGAAAPAPAADEAAREQPGLFPQRRPWSWSRRAVLLGILGGFGLVALCAAMPRRICPVRGAASSELCRARAEWQKLWVA